MQEEENLGGIGIAFCEREEVEVVVTDVEILYFAKGKGEELAIGT